MSFEKAEGIKVTQWTATIPGSKRRKLDKKIPLDYKLSRPQYTIKLRLGDSMTGTAFSIALVDKNGNRYPEYRYELKGEHISKNLIATIASDEGYIHEFYIDYTGRENLTPDKMKVRFSIFDEKGQLIGKEALPFEIKTGGRYYEIDGI